jgi:hypothetical protein
MNFRYDKTTKKEYIMENKIKKSCMDTREGLLKKIEDNLSNLFVDQYDKVNIARNSVNLYLKDIEIDYQYDYNNFCVEFMDNSRNLVNKLPIEAIRELDDNSFVSEVLSFMIKNKIYENIQDPNQRSYLMIQHELKKFLINR